MKILLVTEKYEPDNTHRDGGARLVNTLLRAFGDSLKIMQFGFNGSKNATWYFDYPFQTTDRFKQRLLNANFIAQKIQEVKHHFTHIIFIHVSMQFGLLEFPADASINIITFPMFLTPSYEFSGEKVPIEYFQKEQKAIKLANLVITPSHLEKKQLIEIYDLKKEQIRVIPRGVDKTYIQPQIKKLESTLIFCSIGSIKPQKNVLGLIELFAKIVNNYPNAKLKLIGPIQNELYYKKVIEHINYFKLKNKIEFLGYVPSEEISDVIRHVHFHLSTSLCETFGRAIFETLAAGLPNIARSNNNAAAEFLCEMPYVRFVLDDEEVLSALERMIPALTQLSVMATEVGYLFDDTLLAKLLVAEISTQEIIGISDFDGTLYHKNDAQKTIEAISKFQKYTKRIICSARNLNDLIEQLNIFKLEVDWIIACSGAIVADGKGNICWTIPLLEKDIKLLDNILAEKEYISLGNDILQVCTPTNLMYEKFGLRSEIYQSAVFVSHWCASKLHAIHKLLTHIDYTGRVDVFGDGKYDLQMLTYFDGTYVN